jgi:RNA-directed DNA polymerase
MNLTLDGMETLLVNDFPIRCRKLVHLIRFADDFIITGKSKEILENEIKPAL